MSQELATREERTVTVHHEPVNPFQNTRPDHINAGAVAIEESRAVAEAQGKLVVAKRFPRNEHAAYSKILESCKRLGLAEDATYSFPKGGKTVSGPSIRLAEELARVWGNIDYGIRELSRKDGVSEMESYAWDLETNTSSRQTFSVKHWIDTRDGGKAAKDERDIYEITANQGARRLRARILAVIPGDIVEQALEECRKTLTGNNTEPLADRIRKMIASFDKLGIPAAHLERRLGHTLDKILPDEFVDLQGIYKSIKDGMTTASEWFSEATISQAKVPPTQKNEAPKQETAKPQQAKKDPPKESPKETKKEPPKENTEKPKASTPTRDELPESPLAEIREKLAAMGKTDADLEALCVDMKWIKPGQKLDEMSEFVVNNLVKYWDEAAEALVKGTAGNE